MSLPASATYTSNAASRRRSHPCTLFLVLVSLFVPLANSLPHLIFLDLYNNRVTSIVNLDAVPALRVLMLGKNRITRIANLGSLHKLDVLDLHSNRITEVTGLNHLHELRVLNLAGNQIKSVRGCSSCFVLWRGLCCVLWTFT